MDYYTVKENSELIDFLAEHGYIKVKKEHFEQIKTKDNDPKMAY